MIKKLLTLSLGLLTCVSSPITLAQQSLTLNADSQLIKPKATPLHALSMLLIPESNAVVSMPYKLPLKPFVAYCDENEQAGYPVQFHITAANSNGLTINAAGELVGLPKAAGIYHYQVSAYNERSQTNAVDLIIKVSYDKSKQPQIQFPTDLPTVSLDKPYQLDLSQFIIGNKQEISFSIINSKGRPSDFLSIKEGVYLVGQPQSKLAGEDVFVQILAHSNTGGDSSVEQMALHIAQDPAKKPVIADNIEIVSRAGGQIDYELRNDITDPTHDQNLKVTIDKIEQESSDTSALNLVLEQNTRLHGEIPGDATGQTYTATIHANNQQGGDSEVKQVKIKVVIDRNRTPSFNVENPQFEILKPGLPFFHDFVANGDVYPGYDDAPYTINFAPSYEHPSWLHLENNRLYANATEIPEDVDGRFLIHVVIKNRPGGQSEVITLTLKSSNY